MNGPNANPSNIHKYSRFGIIVTFISNFYKLVGDDLRVLFLKCPLSVFAEIVAARMIFGHSVSQAEGVVARALVRNKRLLSALL